MKVVIFTSDKGNWALKGFFHQWEKYAKGPAAMPWYELEVAGFSRPAELPKEVAFYSIGRFEDYPVERWSDAVMEYLQKLPDELFILMLEDYWLTRPIYHQAVSDAWEFMVTHPNVIRFDLTTDRMYSHNVRWAGAFMHLDLCRAKGDYSMSFQAGIFRRSLLLENLQKHETPWEAELSGSHRLNDRHDIQVYGSYQWPLGYMIVVNKGQLDPEGAWMFPARSLAQADWDELRAAGALPQPEAVR